MGLQKNDYKKLKKQLNLYGFNSYKGFLNSGLWFEFKKVVEKKTYGKRCVSCGKKEGIHLHHLSYKRILDPRLVGWFCEECHNKIHKKEMESVQEATTDLIGKKSKRVGSMRIIQESGLPETLHQSLNASGVIREVKDGKQPLVSLKKYYNRKLILNDNLMLDLLESNYNKVLDYLRTFTTS